MPLATRAPDPGRREAPSSLPHRSRPLQPASGAEGGASAVPARVPRQALTAVEALMDPPAQAAIKSLPILPCHSSQHKSQCVVTSMLHRQEGALAHHNDVQFPSYPN